MIRSMTGFGRATSHHDELTIEVVVSTVNHRFIDIQLRLPESLTGVESQVRALVQQFCGRGRITINVSLEQTRDFAYELNRPMIRGYLAALNMMREEFSIGGEIDINTMASLPNVIQSEDQTILDEADLKAALEQALAKALESVITMRQAEGREIGKEMTGRLDIIERNLALVEKEARSGLDAARERLLKRVYDLTVDVMIEENRLAQEVVLMAQRTDISEEISRLKSHIGQFRAVLESEEASGRKLDFLLQEMNREGSTILAKSAGMAISSAAIEIRTEIEKLREQAQNVE